MGSVCYELIYAVRCLSWKIKFRQVDEIIIESILYSEYRRNGQVRNAYLEK